MFKLAVFLLLAVVSAKTNTFEGSTTQYRACDHWSTNDCPAAGDKVRLHLDQAFV
jgi:hypothetical protein